MFYIDIISQRLCWNWKNGESNRGDGMFFLIAVFPPPLFFLKIQMEFNYGCYLLDIRSCTDAGVAGYAPGTNKLRLIWAMLAKMAGSSEDQKQKKKKKEREKKKRCASLENDLHLGDAAERSVLFCVFIFPRPTIACFSFYPF